MELKRLRKQPHNLVILSKIWQCLVFIIKKLSLRPFSSPSVDRCLPPCLSTRPSPPHHHQSGARETDAKVFECDNYIRSKSIFIVLQENSNYDTCTHFVHSDVKEALLREHGRFCHISTATSSVSTCLPEVTNELSGSLNTQQFGLYYLSFAILVYPPSVMVACYADELSLWYFSKGQKTVQSRAGLRVLRDE